MGKDSYDHAILMMKRFVKDQIISVTPLFHGRGHDPDLKPKELEQLYIFPGNRIQGNQLPLCWS